jgi:hypothetical protein
MLVRGQRMERWLVRPTGDPTWSPVDWARAATLEARWIAAGVPEADRRRLLPCAIWAAKHPGTRYAPYIEERLAELACRI